MPAIHLTAETFQQEVLDNKKTALVDFSATWCGPCKALAPIIDEIAGELPDVLVAKLDIDESMSVAKKFFVMSVPTVVAFKNGEEVGRVTGLRDKSDFLALVK